MFPIDTPAPFQRGDAEPGTDRLAVLTIATVAGLLHVKQDTVRGFIKSGRLKACNLGTRQTRVRPADLAAFIDGSVAGGR
jgi:excisionase family DNA binding protein